MPAQKDRGRRDIVLLSDLDNRLGLHQGTPRAAERAVCHDVDAFLIAEIHDLLLWECRVILNLIHRWHDLGMRQQLLQISLAILDRVSVKGEIRH